jgi:hypothetical protein
MSLLVMHVIGEPPIFGSASDDKIKTANFPVFPSEHRVLPISPSEWAEAQPPLTQTETSNAQQRESLPTLTFATTRLGNN